MRHVPGDRSRVTSAGALASAVPETLSPEPTREATTLTCGSRPARAATVRGTLTVAAARGHATANSAPTRVGRYIVPIIRLSVVVVPKGKQVAWRSVMARMVRSVDALRREDCPWRIAMSGVAISAWRQAQVARRWRVILRRNGRRNRIGTYLEQRSGSHRHRRRSSLVVPAPTQTRLLIPKGDR